MDTAKLTIFNNVKGIILNVSTLSDECYECDFTLQKKVHYQEENAVLHLDTKYGTAVNVSNCSHVFSSCSFKENGEYFLNVSQIHGESSISCQLIDIISPSGNTYLSLLWAVLFYFCLFVVWMLIKALYRYSCFHLSDTEHLLTLDLGSPEDPNGLHHLSVSSEPLSPPQNKRRLRSLDTFRGICIVLMIFVEFGGGKYYFFEHARWNGLTFADLVFPWFMWIMGTSTALSIHSLLRRGVSKKKIFLKIVKRSVLLILLGLFLNTKDDKGWQFDKMRIMGVLQRFGLTYFIVASIDLPFHNANDAFQVVASNWDYVRDLRVSWRQWLIMIMLVAAHTLFTFILPVPGCPTGYLGPGGLAEHGKYYNCTGGAAGYIDRFILQKEHLYQKPTCKIIYKTVVPYDPEGLLGVLTAAFMVFLGMHAGKIVIAYIDHKGRMYRWLSWAVLTGMIGTALCFGEKNGGVIPVNKNLWSLSFVLVLSSLAFIMLTICYAFIDVKSFWSGAPFYYPGMNSILLYLGENLTKIAFPFGWVGCTTHACYLTLALWGTSLWVIVSVCLFYMNVFIAL